MKRSIWYQLALLFVVSISLFASLGMAISRFISPFPPTVWIGLILLSTILAAWLIAVDSSLKVERVGPDTESNFLSQRSWKSLPWHYLPYLFLIPGLITALISVRMALGGHGYHHSANVYQILQGNAPPELVTLPGFTTNSYWIYHALLAVIVSVGNIAPPLSMVLLHSIVLLVTLAWTKWLIGRILPGENRQLILVVLSFFALLGPNLFGYFHSLIRFGLTFPEINAPVVLMGDARLYSMLPRFLTFGGFPLGVLCYMFSLYMCINIIKDGFKWLPLFFVGIGLIGGLAFHATTGIYLFAVIPLSLLLSAITASIFANNYHIRDGKWIRDLLGQLRTILGTRRQIGQAFVVFVALGLLVIPTLLFILESSQTLEQAAAIDLLSLKHLKAIFSISYPVLPFFLLAVYWAIKSRDVSVTFLTYVAMVGAALAYFLVLPEGNEYKFVYLMAIALCTIAAVAIGQLISSPIGKERRIAKAIGIAAILLVFINLIAVDISYIQSDSVIENNFDYENMHINSVITNGQEPYPEPLLGWTQDHSYPVSDAQYADAFQWIRANTPADTVIIVPMMHRDQSSIFVLAERLPYVVDGLSTNNGIPIYGDRVAEVNTLFSPSLPVEQKAEALQAIGKALPERMKVLVYPNELRSGQNDITTSLQELFQGGNANVYLIPVSS